MGIKNILLLLILALNTSGCVCIPYYDRLPDTPVVIDPELVNSIVSNQTLPVAHRSIPDQILDLKDKRKVDIVFKDEFCPCSRKGELSMSVSNVTNKGLVGHKKETFRQWGRLLSIRNDDSGGQNECSSFVQARQEIDDAESLSKSFDYFYLDSYSLIWEAEAALEPLVCDPDKAVILANTAKQLARGEGAKVLGFDFTGTYDFRVTGKHPIVRRLLSKSEHIIIKQDGQKISGTDSSGTAKLAGFRIDGDEIWKEDVIEFKISYPQIPEKELEVELVVSLDGLSVAGVWKEPDSSASGEWKLMKIYQGSKPERLEDKESRYQDFHRSRNNAIEIDYEAIDRITFWKANLDWKAECVGGGSISW